MAVRWLWMAAKQGYDKAEFALGECYQEGWGVDQSSEKAAEWFRKAATKGYPRAQLQLATGLFTGANAALNADEAAMWCRAVHNNPHASDDEKALVEAFLPDLAAEAPDPRPPLAELVRTLHP